MDREGVPLVGITFADGSSDTLVLWKFDSNLDGHFIGHLENEPDACVGMVNHPEYTEFTILSDRIAESGSTTYIWKNTGEVELIPEVFSNGRTSRSVKKPGKEYINDDEDFFSPHHKQELLHDDELILNNMTPLQANSVPKTALLQIKVQGANFKFSLFSFE